MITKLNFRATWFKFCLSNGNEYPAQCVMYNTKFVQKLAFAYRNCPLSLEATKHFQAYINSLLWSGVENFPKCAVYDIFTMLHCPSLLNSIAYDAKFLPFAFSGLTVLVGRQEEHPACKNWVMRCWCGYLSGVRCRLFAYGPADATATPKPHHLLPYINSVWLYLSGTGLPSRLPYVSIRLWTALCLCKRRQRSRFEVSCRSGARTSLISRV